MGRKKRKNFFIDREFQGRYIFKAFLAVAIGSIPFVLAFILFSSSTLSIVYEDYHLKLGTTPELLLNKIFSAQWLFIILVGIAIAVITLFLSHRVAGPVFRFEKTLDKMAAGNLSERIQLRRNDEGKRLAEKINSFNDMMVDILGRIHRDAKEIRIYCDSLKDTEEGSVVEIQKIQELNRNSLEMLSKLKI